MNSGLQASIRWPRMPTECRAAASRRASLPATCELPRDEVHVWAAVLDLTQATIGRLEASLSLAERERAARFRFEVHKNRFIVGRGLVRYLLAWYLGAEPSALDFVYGPHGKPSLANRFGGTGLQFNLAHSEDLALVAITRAGVIGIDVERIRVLDDAEELVARFFSANETAAFRNLTAELKPAAFFSLWTRKEAWLKATGEGIARALHRVEVSFLPGEPARLIRLPSDLGNSECWFMQDLVPAPGFAAALALAANEATLHCWSSDIEAMLDPRSDSGAPG